ncbi:unnamed protein product [Rhizoctonia solani]|uniref:Uncharacterized protein n=1 Tax=Rhizoctonia solani TaxID=456999 RepID=A0A8H3HTG5_9AGAM|nr:unnamed protein product [Rhizoctonia solani]
MGKSPAPAMQRGTMVRVKVPKDSSYDYLKKLLGWWFTVEPENLVLDADSFVAPRNGSLVPQVYKFNDDYMNLTELAEANLVVLIQTPRPPEIDCKAPPRLPVSPLARNPNLRPRPTPTHLFYYPSSTLPNNSETPRLVHRSSFCSLPPKPAPGRVFFEVSFELRLNDAGVGREIARDMWRYRGEDKDAEAEDVAKKIEPSAV